MLLLLDNTVLSNFALAGHADWLRMAFPGQTATTHDVINEFTEGVKRGRLPHTDWDWLPVLALRPDEQQTYGRLTVTLNAGEASCLAIAIHRLCQVLTDDRDARKLAGQRKIPVSGTLGILVYLVKNQHVSLAEANVALHKMIERQYHSPYAQLDELLE